MEILDRMKNFVGEDRNRFLHFAVLKNKADIVSKLMFHGVNHNITNSKGRTALYITLMIKK